MARSFPPFNPRAFRHRVRHLDLAAHPVGHASPEDSPTRPLPRRIEDEDLIVRFRRELEAVGGEVQLVRPGELAAALARAVQAAGATQVLVAWPGAAWLPGNPSQADELGRWTEARVMPAAAARTMCATVEQATASVGVTAAVAALADSGTILIASGPDGAQDASLLPRTHIAILDAREVYPSFSDWVEHGGRSLLAERSSVTLITGPSRTADIEMELTIGVHGPSRLFVLVCDPVPHASREPQP